MKSPCSYDEHDAEEHDAKEHDAKEHDAEEHDAEEHTPCVFKGVKGGLRPPCRVLKQESLAINVNVRLRQGLPGCFSFINVLEFYP